MDDGGSIGTKESNKRVRAHVNSEVFLLMPQELIPQGSISKAWCPPWM